MLFEKVEPAKSCLCSSSQMKNISGVEQFNQSKLNWGADTREHKNNYGGLGNDDSRVIFVQICVHVCFLFVFFAVSTHKYNIKTKKQKN